MSISISGGVSLPGQISFSKPPPPPPSGYALWAWGRNDNFGQLALGDDINRSSPVQVGALTNWANINSGIQHSHGIKTDGTLWGWGRNSYGNGAFIGDNTTIDRSSPVQIGSLTDWSSLNSGVNYHTLVVKTDGTLWAFGRNIFAELGDGTIINRSSPVQIGSLTNWAIVSGGRKNSTAIKTDGTLWSWGGNIHGQLGHGATAQLSSPVQVGSLTDWASVSTGFYHSVALKTNGTIWTWGRNNSPNGQLGLGDLVDRSSPVQIGSLSDWASVSAGLTHSLAIKTNGTLWAWGKGTTGELGDGTQISKSSPIQIGALTDWSVIDAGRSHNLAIKIDGTLWDWADNSHGQLGDETLTNRLSPVQIGSLTDWSSVSAGNRHSIALKTV